MNTTYDSDAGLRRTAAAAAEVDMLQGLGSVILGAVVIAVGVIGNPILLAFGGVLAVSVESWYASRYGRAKPTLRRTVYGTLLSIAAIGLVTVGLAIDGWWPQPILVSLLATAVALAVGLWLGLRRVGLTRWHWVVFALVAVGSLLPLVGIRGQGVVNSVWCFVTGAALVVTGLIDHQRFVEIFGTGRQAQR